MHEGHRKRMRERLLEGEGSLRDHELLEILLYGAVPRKNTNEIAHDLLDTFGGLAQVFRADYQQLLSVNGVGESAAAFLKCVSYCMERADAQTEPHLPKATNFAQVAAYFEKRFRGAQQEFLELYTADSKENMKLAGRFTSYEADKARVAPENIGKILAASRPYCILLVHNHLCDDFNPSAQDDLFTRQIQLLCEMHNVRFYDHLIVSPAGIYSYYRAGEMERIRKEYSLQKIFGSEAK